MVVQRIVKHSPDPVRLGGIGHKLAKDIEENTGLECRVTVLGHLQRGGSPTAFDRILATRFGVKAAELCQKGVSDVMVALQGTDIVTVPLGDTVDKTRKVRLDHHLIDVAQSIGTCLGT
jgi:6-phosphofructokinase 1